jgi:hypothetical protein
MEVIGGALSSTQLIIQFCREVKDAPEEMEQWILRTQTLYSNLEYLHRLIEAKYQTEFNATFSIKQRELLASKLGALDTSLKGLGLLCSQARGKNGKYKQRTKQIRWALVERKTVERFASRLSVAETNLGQLLQIMGL